MTTQRPKGYTYTLNIGEKLRFAVLHPTPAMLVAGDLAARKILQARGDLDAEAEAEVALVNAIAERAIVRFDGVVGTDGAPINDATPEAIRAVMAIPAIWRKFRAEYCDPAYSVSATQSREGNVCVPAPSGNSAGASAIADPA